MTKAFIISELVELTNDEECTVRLAALETMANLLQLLDDGKNRKEKPNEKSMERKEGRKERTGGFLCVCGGGIILAYLQLQPVAEL